MDLEIDDGGSHGRPYSAGPVAMAASATFESALIALGIDPEIAREGFRAPNATVVMLLMAEKYRDLGFGFAPVRVGQKHSFVTGWPELATSDPVTLARWAVEYGRRRRKGLNWFVVTGRERKFIVFDYDGSKGVASRIGLEAKFGTLPHTVKVLTPGKGGGEHYYYRMPPGAEEIKNQQPIPGTAMDLRGYHGGVMTAGSQNLAGIRYEFAPGCAPDEADIAICPETWWEWLPKRVAPQPRARVPRPSSGVKRMQREYHPAASIIGDGPTEGGFNRPIRVKCCQFWSLGFGSEQVSEFKETLRAEILAADHSNHTLEQIERYASNEYLDAELASAEVWINSQVN